MRQGNLPAFVFPASLCPTIAYFAQTVYANEKLQAMGKIYHSTCFKWWAQSQRVHKHVQAHIVQELKAP